MDQRKEEQFLRKRLIDLARSAYHREQCVYTDFLNINEISIFHSMGQELPDMPYSLWGGYVGAERVMVCYHGNLTGKRTDISGSEFHDTNNYPIDCVWIGPSNPKYAGDLNHRDYLGAILNLGIERSTIGDILIHGKDAYVYCDNTISSYIVNSLEKVKHTKVKLSIKAQEELMIQPEFLQINGSVMSIRLDSVISVAFQTSRSSITDYINGERVFVNGKLTTSNSYVLKEGDIISVRGLGKFIYESQGRLTKKGRISITLQKYI